MKTHVIRDTAHVLSEADRYRSDLSIGYHGHCLFASIAASVTWISACRSASAETFASVGWPVRHSVVNSRPCRVHHSTICKSI